MTKKKFCIEEEGNFQYPVIYSGIIGKGKLSLGLISGEIMNNKVRSQGKLNYST